MAENNLQVASGFSLSGGTLGSVVIEKFSGLKLEVETSAHIAGNKPGAVQERQSKPGPPKPGNPTFTAPITSGELPLAQWWKKLNPNFCPGVYQTETLTFSFFGGSGVTAEWQLIGAFPKSYEVSDADVSSASLASETIELCVAQIKRMK